MKKIRVILTDDHILYSNGVKMGLVPYTDIEVLAVAVNGQDLLDKMEYLRPDIVITGIQMPVMDGIQLVPILKRKYPELKIIMLSMMDDAGIIEKLINLGANAYLTKTAAIEDIYEAIITCHEKWFYINDTLREAFIKRHLNKTNKTGFGEREEEILNLLSSDLTIADISIRQNLREKTIEAITKHLIEKAGVTDMAGLIVFAKEKHHV